MCKRGVQEGCAGGVCRRVAGGGAARVNRRKGRGSSCSKAAGYREGCRPAAAQQGQGIHQQAVVPALHSSLSLTLTTTVELDGTLQLNHLRNVALALGLRSVIGDRCDQLFP